MFNADDSTALARFGKEVTFETDVVGVVSRESSFTRAITLKQYQHCELHEYAERRGWQVVGEYVDRGIRGSKDSRLQLNRLMAEAHQRKFDAIVVWKVDRFGRSLRHLVAALADLAVYGVAFISLRDHLDLSTPSGRLMFHVVAAMAEFERELIRERVRLDCGMRGPRARYWAGHGSLWMRALLSRCALRGFRGREPETQLIPGNRPVR